MAWVEPTSCRVEVERGALANATGRYVKRLKDLGGLYADETAFKAAVRRDGERIVYEVTDFRPSAAAGDMIFGVTRMVPGKIGAEYFVTRGHLHARADRPEIYYGESGHGLMLMEAPDGEIRVLEITPRVICYVPPFWIHRSVNVGADDLVMTFAYPADSGQDYDIIARSGGMRQRIVDDGRGGWRTVDNEAYRPRQENEISQIFGTAA